MKLRDAQQNMQQNCEFVAIVKKPNYTRQTARERAATWFIRNAAQRLLLPSRSTKKRVFVTVPGHRLAFHSAALNGTRPTRQSVSMLSAAAVVLWAKGAKSRASVGWDSCHNFNAFHVNRYKRILTHGWIQGSEQWTQKISAHRHTNSATQGGVTF